MKRDFQIDFLKKAGLQPGHTLIDIGCGTLRGGIPLIRYLEEERYYGVEIREAVLEEGRRELQEAGLTQKSPVLCVGELDTLNFGRKADFVWAFSVLFHMNDGDVEKCLGFVARHLGSDGKFYANVNIGDGESGFWQGFPVNYRPWEFYAALAGRYGLCVEDLGDLRGYGHLTGTKQDNQRMLLFQRARSAATAGPRAARPKQVVTGSG